MQFRDAIEQDARDLRELSERAAKISNRPSFLRDLVFEGEDWAAHERTLDQAAMDLRQAWLKVAHGAGDTTLKSPREGQVTHVPSGRAVSFGYEREIDVGLLEQRGPSYIDRETGWSSDVILFRSGQAALACLLQFAIAHWGRSDALTVAHAGAYFETASLLKSWPQRVLRQVPVGRDQVDIAIAEPVWCDGAFSRTDGMPSARRALIIDTTM